MASPPTLRTVNNFKLVLWEGEVRGLLRTDSRILVTTQNAYGEEFYAHGTVTSKASKPRAASPPSLRTAINFQPGSWEGEVSQFVLNQPRTVVTTQTAYAHKVC